VLHIVRSRQHPQKLQLRTAGTGRPLGDIDSPSGPEDACNNFPTMGDSHPWHVTSQIDLGRRHTAAAILLEAPLRDGPKSKERDRWTASRLTSISMRRRPLDSGYPLLGLAAALHTPRPQWNVLRRGLRRLDSRKPGRAGGIRLGIVCIAPGSDLIRRTRASSCFSHGRRTM
jgi:hypothetical protein